MSNKQKREAILKSQIEIARRGAEDFISDLAALIRDRDCPNLPTENVRMTLEHGQCPCACALRLLQGE